MESSEVEFDLSPPPLKQNKIAELVNKFESIKQEEIIPIKETTKCLSGKQISIFIFILYFCTSLFIYKFVDKQYFYDDDKKKIHYKKFLKLSIYMTVGNIIYLSCFYLFLKTFII